jgi:CMP/dCMP kinase
VTVIAIDGPAGSGKSTIARAVAERTGLEVLDTGAMYRAVTFAVLRAGADPTDPEVATDLAERSEIVLEGGQVHVDGEDATAAIRGPEVSAAVSVVSTHPGVRARLRELQRDWMAAHGGGVVEGRDIGTVVFPDAELKVFLTASPEVRARRRAGEGVLDESSAAANIAHRDHLDSTRADSPLAEADGAVVIDTSELGIDDVVSLIVGRLA